MICRLLYAHKSLFGSDGYGFAGYSSDANPAIRRKTEALLNKLGYDERSLRDSPAYFWLNLDADAKILGKVTLREAHGKKTLYYQTIIVSTDALEKIPDGPFAFSPEFQDESAWMPGKNYELPVPRCAPPWKVKARSPAMWTEIAIPGALIRGFETEILQRWYGGLSARDKQSATFMVPYSPRPSIKRHCSATCHFGTQPNKMPSRMRTLISPKALVIGCCACAGIGFVAGTLIPFGIGSETGRVIVGEEPAKREMEPDYHQQTIMVTAEQEQELIGLARAMEGLANNLLKLDGLDSILPQFRPMGEHPLTDTFTNLKRYIDRAQREDVSVHQRLNDVFFAIDEFERILSVRRNLDAHTAEILKRVKDASHHLANMQRRPDSENLNEAALQEKLKEADALISRLKEALEITSAAEATADSH